MRSLYCRCAGLDIHKDGFRVYPDAVRGSPKSDIEEAVFSTFTQQLEGMAAWLREHKVRRIQMESTGVYWRPVWNSLEQPKYGFHLLLVNPATVRGAAGLQDRPHRCLPHRRAMLALLAEGVVRPERLADEALGQLRRQDAGTDSILALEGRTDEHFQWMLERLLRKLEGLDSEMAELGTDMTQFPSSSHAASWAGLSGRCRKRGQTFQREDPEGRPVSAAYHGAECLGRGADQRLLLCRAVLCIAQRRG